MTDKNTLRQSILQTLSYADVFDYPLTKNEIHRYLIRDTKENTQSPRTVLYLKKYNLDNSSEVENSLTRMLQEPHPNIDKVGKFFTLKGRSQIIELRKKRKQFSKEKIAIANKVGKWLRLIPTIKMIAITGALAMENSDKNDDIDLMIITSKDRLWLTRLFVVPLISLVANRRKPTTYNLQPTTYKNTICLNLFLDETVLVMPKNKRNLYTAHEVVQIKPLWSRDGVHELFFAQNAWISHYLPNAMRYPSPFQKGRKGGVKEESMENGKCLPRTEWYWGKMVNSLEHLAFKLQLLYMKPKITTEVITQHSAFFHPRNTTEYVLNQYLKRLKNYQ
jgi:hypothetical protein